MLADRSTAITGAEMAVNNRIRQMVAKVRFIFTISRLPVEISG